VAKTGRPKDVGDAGNAGLSDDELMTAARKAINDAAPGRSALLQAVKRKLASGEIGTDSARLADRIIDDLLDN
jgi:hypothetical protein